MTKFKYYEEVIINSEKEDLKCVNGNRGVIFSEPDQATIAVYILDLEECWMIDINDLESTGRVYRREDFYDETQISVRVDSKGNGTIK